MSRLFTAFIAAAIMSAAAPAAAFNVDINFPTLTYPTQPSPEVGQGCTDFTSVNGVSCPATDK